MSRNLSCLLATCLVLSSVLSPLAFADDAPTIQGEWAVTEFIVDGRPLPETDVKGTEAEFTGDLLTIANPKPPIGTKEYRFQLSPNQRPAEINLTRNGKSLPGIYELNKDSLKLCVPMGDGVNRPNEFKAPADSGLLLMVMKRIVETPSKRLQKLLNEAKLPEGIAIYEEQLRKEPENQEARASLGLLQFIHAVEGLAQDYYRFGFQVRRSSMFGVIQIQVPENPNPEPIEYKDARQAFIRLVDRLAIANKTLETFKPCDLKLSLDVTKINLNIDSNGKTDSYESFAKILVSLSDPRAVFPDFLKSLSFTFDDADVTWMQGYVNLLSAFGNIVLAHDWQEAFERTSHLFFARTVTPYAFFREEKLAKDFSWSSTELVDFIALIHLLRFEVVEPERMKTALAHFETVIRLSRETWRRIRIESDDDHEWIPGPKQHSIVLNSVGGQLGEDWEKVLDQAQAILEGRELLPFWRGLEDPEQRFWERIHPRIGINVRKIFLEPKRFDLIAWLQGTGVAPFLEEGKIAKPESWRDLNRPFGNRLPFFSLWIN